MKKLYIATALALAVLPAFALSSKAASVSWNAVTANVDGSALAGPVTYNLYQGAPGALSKVQSGLSTTAATVSSGLTAGQNVCFAVTAVVQGVESAQSTAVCALVPFPTPNAPTQVVVVISG